MKDTRHNPQAWVDAHAACGLPWLTRHEAPQPSAGDAGENMSHAIDEDPWEKNVEKNKDAHRIKNKRN